ncbi:N-acetylmuramoyl-L-alanine amidase [Suttonella indologenes]|uniref:N-acetylmuramoyl-L-alanine amidase n=1 Tax=Suttonella indologenes TaxID=13276 RepID=A0A380MIL5_9GAMM|nr:N-acetylmuramoyl-L-alanine amidase [Suttonella indologenes]SUO92007.1 N-acetylmuramoyl-L-alanine amidase AmiC precursor [Suttonella indologenes]
MYWKKPLLLVLLCCASIVQAATVSNIRYNRMPQKVQLVLDTDAAIPFQQFSLANPPRIVLDFKNVHRSGRAGLVVNEGAVAGVRSGMRDPNTLRVVIDLIATAKANIYTLPPDRQDGNRIVVDVYDFESNPALTLTSIDESMPNVIFSGAALEDQGSSATANTQANQNPIARVAPNHNAQHNAVAAALPPATIAAPAQTTVTIEREVTSNGLVQRKVEVSTPPLINKRDIVVCIDAGHGGKDPGAINQTLNLREKDLVLAISKRLQRQLDTMPGYRVVMTRNNDIFIPLRERTNICRRAKGDLFVSIHADAVERSEPSGSSVYILSTTGATSQLARYLANSENAVDLKWGVDVEKYDDDIQAALLNIQQEATLESSNILASKTISELGKIGKVHKRHVERANFTVLRSPEIPSMLVETAFISNLSDAKLLASQAYQEKLARAIAGSIDAYFREHLPQHMLLAR